jgi:hypothetical protein
VSVEDDIEMEEWLEMSEAQQNAALERAMREYGRMIDAMPEKDRIRHFIRGALANCRSYRRTLKVLDIDIIRQHLRGCQHRLLKLRIWRQTGIYPGSA